MEGNRFKLDGMLISAWYLLQDPGLSILFTFLLLQTLSILRNPSEQVEKLRAILRVPSFSIVRTVVPISCSLAQRGSLTFFA